MSDVIKVVIPEPGEVPYEDGGAGDDDVTVSGDIAWRAQVCAQSLARLSATREATEAQGKALIAALKAKLDERLKELDRESEGEQENLRFLLAERRAKEGKTLKLLTDSGDWAEVSFRAWPRPGTAQKDGKHWRITGWDESLIVKKLEGNDPGGVLTERVSLHASKAKAMEWFIKTGEILPGVEIEEDTRPDQVSVKLEKKEITA